MPELPHSVMDVQTRDNMRRALEDNERVFFHPEKALIAVWCGGATVNIYDPQTWEEVDMFTQSIAFRDDSTLEDVENAITVRLAERGFVREGRGSGVQSPRTTIKKR